MLIEAQARKQRFGWKLQNVARLLSCVDLAQDADEPAHNARIAVGDEIDLVIIRTRDEPHVALAAMNAVFFSLFVVGQWWKFPPQIDEETIAVFPRIEKLE